LYRSDRHRGASLPSALQALTSYYQTFAPWVPTIPRKLFSSAGFRIGFGAKTDIPLLSFLERLYADAEQKMKKNSLRASHCTKRSKTEEASGNSGDNRADSFRAAIRAICTYDSAAGVMHVIIPPGCSGSKRRWGNWARFSGLPGAAWVCVGGESYGLGAVGWCADGSA